MYVCLHVSNRYACQILMKLSFLASVPKYAQTYNCTIIRPVGADLFHADGQADIQTDMTKVIAAFNSFGNAPKIAAVFRLCF